MSSGIRKLPQENVNAKKQDFYRSGSLNMKLILKSVFFIFLLIQVFNLHSNRSRVHDVLYIFISFKYATETQMT